MQPEPGDPNVRVTRADVTEALHSVGVGPGDTFLFHSSLSSMGTVVGGPDTVIDGLLDAVSPGGTIAVPTLCNWLPDEQDQVFRRWDPKTTPSYVGRMTEAFRARPEAVRSDHATHSVAAIGARAAELTADHGAGRHRLGPFGEGAFCGVSPWERLVEWNAAYGFIGVDFRVNTMVHYVESRIVERALERAEPALRAELADEVIGWLKPGVWPQIRIEDRAVFEEHLAAQGGVRKGKLGSATIRVARARPMVEAWLALLEADPARWFPEPFLAWLARVPAGEAA